MDKWKPSQSILGVLQQTQTTLFRLQRLELLQQLVRMKKQLEMEGVDTSAIFTPALLSQLEKEINGDLNQ